MRIGRYQLRGIRKRFWFLLGLIVVLIFLAFYFWPEPEDPFADWKSGRQTAFSEIGFQPVEPLRDSSLGVEDIFSDKRLSDCSENRPQCIYSVQDPTKLVQYWDDPENTGIPFRFRAYLPSQEATAEGATEPLPAERQSLYSEDFSEGGWSFRPAILLDALNLTEASTGGVGFDPGILDIEAANAFSLTDDFAIAPGAMLLGFQEGVPASGAIYDFDAMLFSTSNAIKNPGPPYSAQPIPALLVRDFRPVGNEEVLEPATEVSNLDITYSAGERYQLSLHNFEWPADGKARMCVTLSNRSSSPVPLWGGLYDGIRLRVGGVTLLGSPAVGSRFEVGTETEELQTGESLSGYIVFGLEQEGISNVANVSGSPGEQEVRLSIGSLLQAEPGSTGSLISQEAFIDISNGAGGGIPFQSLGSKQEEFVVPLEDNEACSE